MNVKKWTLALACLCLAPLAQSTQLDEGDAVTESTRRMLAAHCASQAFAERYVSLSQQAIRRTGVSADADYLETLASQAPAWTAAQVDNVTPEDCADHLAVLISLMKQREIDLVKPQYFASRDGKSAHGAGSPMN